MRAPRIAATLAAVLTLAAAASACGGGDASATSAPSPTAAATATGTSSGMRPSSPAVLTIVSPADGSTVTGRSIHVVVDLRNATVIQATSSKLSPTEGHVHLYIDGNLQYMAYTLAQDFPVTPGTYTIKAEFVASDHVPFQPRVYSPQIVFTVK